MSWFDYGMVVAFLVGMVLIGLYSKKNVKNAEDFYVAGGKVPWWLAGGLLSVFLFKVLPVFLFGSVY